jgi:hypothetical protein
LFLLAASAASGLTVLCSLALFVQPFAETFARSRLEQNSTFVASLACEPV